MSLILRRKGWKDLNKTGFCKLCNKTQPLVWVYWLNPWARCKNCLLSIERINKTTIPSNHS